MTINQIANFTQRDVKTVRRWIKKAGTKCPAVMDKMSSSGHGVAADFTIDEVENILKASTMSKDAISILMANARTTNAPSSVTSNILSTESIQMISTIVVSAVNAAMSQLIEKINIPGPSVPAPKLITAPVEAPKKDSRAHITELVRKYANATKLPFADVYSMLYTEYGYRTHTDPTKCAMNREMRIIDYISSAGKLEELEAVAIDYLIPPKKYQRAYLAE